MNLTGGWLGVIFGLTVLERSRRSVSPSLRGPRLQRDEGYRMTSAALPRVELIRLGSMSYTDARAVQEKLYRSIREGRREDGALIIVEHPDTITVGRQPDSARHILAGADSLDSLGVEVVRADRGGDVTWHGPGQLVAYSILPLRRFRKDVGWYLRKLEAVGVATLAAFGVEAFRAKGMTGVWTEQGKIMAIGVGVGGWVTYHGLCLNCSCDLTRYDLIVPCGLSDSRVTSLSQITGRTVTTEEAEDSLIESFVETFELAPLVEAQSPAPPAEVIA